MDALADKLSIHVEEWETDGLGLARGALLKLTSGRVVLLYELAHSVDHFDARGPTVEVDAGEAAALGLSSLMNEVKVDLGLRDEEIVAINHDADDWRRDAAIASRYPPGWTSLKWPWLRAELLTYLAEIMNPAETANWLSPDPDGPIVGIDQCFHFFFDDHDFDAGDIGYSLFDEAEAEAIAKVKRALEAIRATNEQGDDRYLLKHSLWPSVVTAAGEALIMTADNGTDAE